MTEWMQFSNRQIKARKSHRCCECGIVIKPKETYWRYRGMSDSKAFSVATCLECEDDRQLMYMGLDASDFPVAFGSVGEWWDEVSYTDPRAIAFMVRASNAREQG